MTKSTLDGVMLKVGDIVRIRQSTSGLRSQGVGDGDTVCVVGSAGHSMSRAVNIEPLSKKEEWRRTPNEGWGVWNRHLMPL